MRYVFLRTGDMPAITARKIRLERITFGAGRIKEKYLIDKSVVFCGACSKWRGGSIPLVRTSLLSTPTVGLRRHYFNGDGDFRSTECIELLKQADIVVTNPPFSLFREYVAQLVEYEKNFLIVGNQNAITYKEIFKLIKENEIWLGSHSGDMKFKVPDYYEPRETRFWIDETGQKWRSLGNACWFTNLDLPKRHEELVLYKKYSEDEYPHYDNYDAIEVGKTELIPENFDGVMGVPITFLNKYNPEQFEILGMESSAGYDSEIVGIPRLKEGDARPAINGKTTYARIFIRRRKEA